MGSDEQSDVPPPPQGPVCSDLDEKLLAISDAEFKLLTWDRIVSLIATGSVADVCRKPSDHRRYQLWAIEASRTHGSALNYLINVRLPKSWGRPPYTPESTVPLQCPSDYCVLSNDWPYGTEPGIVHVVVWMRTRLPTDEAGELTPSGRVTVEHFINAFFVPDLGPGGRDRIAWFKNPPAQQSIIAIDHFHVFLRDAAGPTDEAAMNKWLGVKKWHEGA